MIFFYSIYKLCVKCVILEFRTKGRLSELKTYYPIKEKECISAVKVTVYSHFKPYAVKKLIAPLVRAHKTQKVLPNRTKYTAKKKKKKKKKILIKKKKI